MGDDRLVKLEEPCPLIFGRPAPIDAEDELADRLDIESLDQQRPHAIDALGDAEVIRCLLPNRSLAEIGDKGPGSHCRSPDSLRRRDTDGRQRKAGREQGPWDEHGWFVEESGLFYSLCRIGAGRNSRRRLDG